MDSQKLVSPGSPSPGLDSGTSGPVWRRFRLQPGGSGPSYCPPSSAVFLPLHGAKCACSVLPQRGSAATSAVGGGGGGATTPMWRRADRRAQLSRSVFIISLLVLFRLELEIRLFGKLPACLHLLSNRHVRVEKSTPPPAAKVTGKICA